MANDELGPIAQLIGKWEGIKGDDTAPSDDRGTEKNSFREIMIYEPTALVQNHEQLLYGLKYSTKAWRLGEENAFHETLGYWMWDENAKQLMRCFLVPRGVASIAGATVNLIQNDLPLKQILDRKLTVFVQIHF